MFVIFLRLRSKGNKLQVIVFQTTIVRLAINETSSNQKAISQVLQSKSIPMYIRIHVSVFIIFRTPTDIQVVRNQIV